MRIDIDEEEMKKAKKLEIKRIIRSETMKKKSLTVRQLYRISGKYKNDQR